MAIFVCISKKLIRAWLPVLARAGGFVYRPWRQPCPFCF